MASHWILTALGRDRPGIVAGVTKLLFQAGCNLEDSAMTRLESEFAMIVIFSAPSHLSLAQLTRSFHPVARRLQLVLHVKPLTRGETQLPATRGKAYLVSVYGADRPGIVYRVSHLLAQRRINITDVTTHRSAGKKTPLYLMVLEIEVPSGVTISSLQRSLKALARTLDVELSVRPTETHVL